MSLFTAQVRPGQALGFLVLGATLHDILTRLKAEPQRFPKIDLVYELTSPVKEPVILGLPTNGIRLRFDGPEQRLRLIEVLDFTKSHFTYNDRDVLRPVTATQVSSATSPTPNQSGPTYRHIYKNLLGPTFPGEYIEPDADDDTSEALYILSYPGLAFSFPIPPALWSTGKDAVSLLSSSTSPPASSMAIFSGDSWADAQERLYTQAMDPSDAFGAILKGKDSVPAEVRLVKIYGGGRLELVRSRNHNPFWIQLGHTSPQELVAELGPPDAIYRKSDQRMSIHKARQGAGANRLDPNDIRLHDDSTDTDQSSAHTATDDSDEDNEEGEAAGNVSGECFYNYFYHGIDVLMSPSTTPSQHPPSQDSAVRDGNPEVIVPTDASTCLVASKLILHGNVPGSYPFNRHRRCRWEIQYLSPTNNEDTVNSETPFAEIESRLHEEWKSIYKSAEEAKARQRGMVLNRDWGDSPGSSCELLGGWEDSVGGRRLDAVGAGTEDVKGLGNTTLFGFPGLVFEVLKNGIVSSVTVF